MKNLNILIVVFCLLANVSFAQRTEKVFLNPTDSTVNYYLAVYPAKQPYTGFMFLIPGFGETPEFVLTQTDLPLVAAKKGILTIIPTFATGTLSLSIDSLTMQSFKEILNYVTSKHNLIQLPFFVGGFSIGGSCAIKFAETANAENLIYKPTAVFAIDPPLDFERFYHSSQRTLRIAPQSPLSREAAYIMQLIEGVMGGTPQESLSNYYKLSPYSLSDTTQAAIKKLLKTPIMIYSEPDINWWIRERGSDCSEMNILDCSSMINELNLLGNKRAFLVITENKGYRQPNNRRHPHSWSIADPKELTDWLLGK